MVWHHIAEGACGIVELPPGLNAHRLGGSDLDVADVIAVPEWLEDTVGKAQHQDVLDRFLAEEMVDPIDLVLAQNSQDLRVGRSRRRQVVAEGLFDDHAPPLSARLACKLRATEMLNDRSEELVG